MIGTCRIERDNRREPGTLARHWGMLLWGANGVQQIVSKYNLPDGEFVRAGQDSFWLYILSCLPG